MKTGTQRYMESVELARKAIDLDMFRMAQSFLDEAKDTYHDLNTEASILSALGSDDTRFNTGFSRVLRT